MSPVRTCPDIVSKPRGSGFGVAALVAAIVAGRDVDPPDLEQAKRTRFLLPILVGLALLIYWPAIRIGLLSDDFVLLSWVRRGDLMPPEWPHVRVLPFRLRPARGTR